jgi:Fe-S-cluster-containing dehydrogenase component
MTRVFAVDVSKCNGCYNCQLACEDEHVSNDWAPYSRPKPEIGQFWVKLRENGGTIPIEAKGYEYKTFDAVDAARDVNLGDIPLAALAEVSGC